MAAAPRQGHAARGLRPHHHVKGNCDDFVSLADINPFAALSYGNAAAARTFTWDTENRLVRVEPTDGAVRPDGAQRLILA